MLATSALVSPQCRLGQNPGPKPATAYSHCLPAALGGEFSGSDHVATLFIRRRNAPGPPLMSVVMVISSVNCFR